MNFQESWNKYGKYIQYLIAALIVIALIYLAKQYWPQQLTLKQILDKGKTESVAPDSTTTITRPTPTPVTPPTTADSAFIELQKSNIERGRKLLEKYKKN